MRDIAARKPPPASNKVPHGVEKEKDDSDDGVGSTLAQTNSSLHPSK
jgi:hypothetical protein